MNNRSSSNKKFRWNGSQKRVQMAIMNQQSYDVLIIGGGFYGAYIALHFARRGSSVLICEDTSQLMSQASYINQARIHAGYHYPRSVLTGLRSKISYPKFVQEFPDCVDESFKSYYMVGKNLSKVTAKQFKAFCDRIGAYCVAAPDVRQQLTDMTLVEEVFETHEGVFDAIKLKNKIEVELSKYQVRVQLNSRVLKVSQDSSIQLRLDFKNPHNEIETVFGRQVFNCTYSGLNLVHHNSELPIVPLKYQLTEMCLVRVPEGLKSKGFTMMCGPFFSLTPFPSTDLHALSHVRYTPHRQWSDSGEGFDPVAGLKSANDEMISNWGKMKKDASRYMSLINDCEYVQSIWSTKALLPLSGPNDSRPILFQENHGINNFHCVLGGKIDNVYDVVNVISAKGLDRS